MAGTIASGPPKAEVTGSNPVGCAKLSNDLGQVLHRAGATGGALKARNPFGGGSRRASINIHIESEILLRDPAAKWLAQHDRKRSTPQHKGEGGARR
jgi:hypothetical protein